MNADYDDVITSHYAKVAERAGASSASTMADITIRQRETNAILEFVRLVGTETKLRIMDVGCGNGYTLSRLWAEFPQHDYAGVEYTTELLDIAQDRFEGTDIQVEGGDIREPGFAEGLGKFDVIICQRVLINLLDPADQKLGLENILRFLKPGGYYFSIEAYREQLDILNEAREELDLGPIDSAHHNLYLTADFFEDFEGLKDYSQADWKISENDLSTHYFVSRVFFPWVTRDKPLKRNAHFMRFFSEALKPGVGQFAPLRIRPFQKS